MNFPSQQQTGLLAELDVTRLFSKWGWTVGQDLLDVGYDHFVEPDQKRYRGARFLVQTKGTAKSKKGKVVAQVSKPRLRQYAANPLPVFLVRVNSLGEMFWLHVQPWCMNNRDRISGNGYAGVSFNSSNRLINRVEFEAYLRSVLPRDGAAGDIVAKAATARMEFLKFLDPRLDVAVSGSATASTYVISAAKEEAPVEGEFSFTISSETQCGKAAKADFERFVDFGSPVSIHAKDFVMSGSPVFSELGLDERHEGKISFARKPLTKCVVTLVAAEKFDVWSPSLVFDTDVFKGAKGLSFVMPDRGELIRVSSTMEQEAKRLSGTYTISLNPEKLHACPIRDLASLQHAMLWAEAVFNTGKLTIVLDASVGRMTATTTGDDLAGFTSQLSWLVLLGRLHLIEKYLGSDFILPAGAEFLSSESSNIALGYRLLRGEVVDVDLPKVEVQDSDFRPIEKLSDLVIRSALKLSVDSTPCGELPIEILLNAYVLVADEDGVLAAVEAENSSRAQIRLAAHEFNSGSTSR